MQGGIGGALQEQYRMTPGSLSCVCFYPNCHLKRQRVALGPVLSLIPHCGSIVPLYMGHELINILLILGKG